MYTVFIDGEAGTTGLQVMQRLNNHPEIDILSIDPELRKDSEAKKALMDRADITVLCLPDEAAIESAKLARDISARVIDASTAHRCHGDWVYGLPEMAKNQRQLIASARQVSNPGCYSTGAILLLRPLVEAGLNMPYNIHAVTGYSGGGNHMIDNYEHSLTMDKKAYSLYGLGFNHKHLPEIIKYTSLSFRPTFFPAVVNISQGMMIQVAIHEDAIEPSIVKSFIDGYANFGEALLHCLTNYYRNEPTINVHDINEIDTTSAPFLTIEGNAGGVETDVYVYYNPEFRQALIVARFDNLGKGASGAAVQNINIMLGLDEALGVGLTK